MSFETNIKKRKYCLWLNYLQLLQPWLNIIQIFQHYCKVGRIQKYDLHCTWNSAWYGHSWSIQKELSSPWA